MLGWIRKLLGRRTAVEKSRENPIVQAAVNESTLVYERIPLGELIDEERRSSLARDLYLDVVRIANSTDPVTDCRDEFTRALLGFAAYQVLVVPPAPEADPSGLRGLPGVSGELQAHLVELCRLDNDLRSTMFELTESRDPDELRRHVERLYWEANWRLGTLDGLRIAMGDSIESDDWYGPFLQAACMNQENAYRWALELPPAFDEDIAREAVSACSVFTDIVLSGAVNPAAEWREYCREAGAPESLLAQ